MSRCESMTKNGERCKKVCKEGKKTCHIHDHPDCPICMNNMNDENSRRLECGHVFHPRCLEIWKRRNSTCPICRAPFDQPMYKVKITIEPNNIEHETVTSNIQNLVDFFELDPLTTERFFSTISFSVMNNLDLTNIFDRIGIVPPGMYPPGFNTEGRTEL